MINFVNENSKRSPWLYPLIVMFVFMVGLVVYALITIFSLIGVPGKGVFRDALEGNKGNGTNITNTLFEETVDKLSGDRVPILLFARDTNYCRGQLDTPMKSIACVSRMNPNHIAIQEELIVNMENAWKDAVENGLESEAELLNQWESFIAAHEFAHILQYNYFAETKPFLSVYGKSEIPQVELQADCYAGLIYPMPEETYFHLFPSSEKFPQCTDEQNETTREWAETIGWPIPEKELIE